MKAVESLIQEHKLIGRLADALEVYAQQTKQGPLPDATHLGQFAAAFIEFAECIHHEKEESILLPMLARHGVRWDEGALASVRREHRQETYLIDVLRQAGERLASWHEEDRRHISAAAQALVDFQRHHHALEAAQVFPLLGSSLQPRDLDDLQQALATFDRRHEPQRAAVLERMEVLIARYGRAPISGAHPRAAQSLEAGEGSERCPGPDE
jgi:hemerythrin-like domain-containing protein